MNKFVKGALFLVPALALVGGLSTAAIADSHGKGNNQGENCDHGDQGDRGSKGMRGMGDKGGKMNSERLLKKLNSKLDLTDAQEAEMKEVFERQGSMRDGHQGANQAMYDELAKLTVGTDAYNAQIDLIAESHASMMASGMKVRAQMNADILNILNDEQKVEFSEMMEKIKGRMGMRGSNH